MQHIIDDIERKKAVIFGGGSGLKKWYGVLGRNKGKLTIEFLCDNDSKKWGKINPTIPIPVSSPQILADLSSDHYYVIIVSVYYQEIRKQVMDLNPKMKVYEQSDISRFLYRSERDKLENYYCIDYETRIKNWMNLAFEDEVDFWDSVLKDVIKKDDCRLRVREFVYPYANIEIDSKTQILDVGSGPIPKFGNQFNGNKINYIPVDPLVYQYHTLMKKYELNLPETPKFAIMENLTLFYEPNSMDYVIVNNALDHSIDIVRSLVELIQVTKIGGLLCTWHRECEAVLEKYCGIHNWNIYMDTVGDLTIGDRSENKMNITALFKDFAQIETTRSEDGFVTANIKKLNEVPTHIVEKYANRVAGGILIRMMFEYLNLD